MRSLVFAFAAVHAADRIIGVDPTTAPGGVVAPELSGLEQLAHRDGRSWADGINLEPLNSEEPLQKAVYIPSSRMAFCACLKCGTTSLFHYVYGAVKGRSFCEDAIANATMPSTSHAATTTSASGMDTHSVGGRNHAQVKSGKASTVSQ